MKRLVIAAVLIPLLYLYIMKLPEGAFFGLIAVVALLGLYEFYRIFRLRMLLTVLSILGGLVLLWSLYKGAPYTVEILTLSFIMIALVRMLSPKDPSGALHDTGLAITGIIYIVFLLSFQLKLRHMGPEWIIFLYGVVWVCDSAAYYVGSTFGKRKLYPQVSPKKTVEGALASVAGGVAGSIILGRLLGIGGDPLSGIIIGALCIAGDLLESMYKRDAGVKDSSNLIPGHGGILDKIDSALIVAPFVYWYIKL